MKIKLGVIFGGTSVEHEVSIISAVQAMEFINQEKYDIIPIYITKDRTLYTGKMLMNIDVYRDFDILRRYAKKCVMHNKNGNCVLQSMGFFKTILAELDIVLPIVHGNNVEDGTLAGFLETIGVPYVGSHVMGAALGQDKVMMKQVLKSENLPIVDYTWFFDTDYLMKKEQILKDIKKIGYPVIVKPATLGSSVGITVVKDEDSIDQAINEAIRFDTKIVVEQVVPNLVEVNCSILGSYEHQEVSVLEEVMSKDEFLTYKDKYIGNGKTKGASKGMVSATRIIPARLDQDLTNKIKDISKEVFKVFNLSGVCRIDYLVDKKKNKVYVNEPNTIPGSLAFYLWEPIGKSYTELLDEMVTIAIKEYKNKNKKEISIDTNILSSYGGTKGLKGMKGKLKY